MFIPRKKTSAEGVELSEIIYGTKNLLEDPKGYYYGRVLEKLNICLENGITSFEISQTTATQSCEIVIGNALRQEKSLRNKIEIISKVQLPLDEPKNFSDKKVLIQKVNNSLENLGLEKIHLLLIKIPNFHFNIYEVAEAIQQLIHDGKILQVGISNPTYSQIFMLQSYLNSSIATCEFHFNPLHKEAIRNGLFDACMQLRIKPIISYPCEFGNLFRAETENHKNLINILNTIAKEKHASLEEVILSWIIQHPSSPFVIIGTEQTDRISLFRDYRKIRISRLEWEKIFRFGEE